MENSIPGGTIGPGILGIGSDEGSRFTTPTRVGSATNWATVSAGLGTHVLATTLGGALYAWGMNDYGQLGLGDTTNRNAPVQVGSVENWASISAGSTHSVAVNNAGELFTWGGRYTSGRLGQGSEHINTPTRVGTGTGWLRVAAGGSHTLATMALTVGNGLLSASGVMDSYGEVSPYASATWSIDGGTTWNAGGGAIQLPAGTYTITWGGADDTPLRRTSSSVTITAGQATVVQGTTHPASSNARHPLSPMAGRIARQKPATETRRRKSHASRWYPNPGTSPRPWCVPSYPKG